MTNTDNASGAGMKTVAWRYVDACGHFRYRGYQPNFDVEYAILKPIALVSRTDASRLLAEKEGELQRLREALAKISAIENCYYGTDWQEIDEAREIAQAALDGKEAT